MDLLYCGSPLILQVVLMVLFLASLFLSLAVMFKTRSCWSVLFNDAGFYAFTCLLLVLMFKLQNVVFGVNYPENRTVLFFYLLFALSVTFMFDRYLQRAALPVSIFTGGVSLVIFIFSMGAK